MAKQYDCLYISEKCDHVICGEYPFYGQQHQPVPTEEDYCAAEGHAYYGDDMMDEETVLGRCYCGHSIYQPGGPVNGN